MKLPLLPVSYSIWGLTRQGAKHHFAPALNSHWQFFGFWLYASLAAVPATWIAPAGESAFQEELLEPRPGVLRLFGPFQPAICFAEFFLKSMCSLEVTSNYCNLKYQGKYIGSSVSLQYWAIPEYQRVFLSCICSHWCLSWCRGKVQWFVGKNGSCETACLEPCFTTDFPSYLARKPLWASSTHLGIKSLLCKSHQVLCGWPAKWGGRRRKEKLEAAQMAPDGRAPTCRNMLSRGDFHHFLLGWSDFAWVGQNTRITGSKVRMNESPRLLDRKVCQHNHCLMMLFTFKLFYWCSSICKTPEWQLKCSIFS